MGIGGFQSGPILLDVARELAMFAALGYALFALDDFLVDGVYFARKARRALTVYALFPRLYAERLSDRDHGRGLVLFIPAWDESNVIGDMLRATLRRYGAGDYHLYVGY